MANMMTIDRETLLAELEKAFDKHTSEVLLDVLDKVAAQVHASVASREDFSELKQIVSEMAEIQKRTDERIDGLAEKIEELAEAQKRTEQRVEELAEAQKRTEQRVEELAEAQKHTIDWVGRLEMSIEKLAQSVDQLRKQVGGLSETVGGDIEDIAYIVLYDVLKREFGWEVGVLERSWEVWNGEPEEVNIFGMATDPARPEKDIWIVGEAKHNLTIKEVEKFKGQVDRAGKHLKGEIFPVCFCYRARPEVQKQVKDAGIRLVFSYGKIV